MDLYLVARKDYASSKPEWRLVVGDDALSIYTNGYVIHKITETKKVSVELKIT